MSLKRVSYPGMRVVFAVMAACLFDVWAGVAVAQSEIPRDVLVNVFRTEEHLRIAVKNTLKSPLDEPSVIITSGERSVTKKIGHPTLAGGMEVVKVPYSELEFDPIRPVTIRVFYKVLGIPKEILQVIGFGIPSEIDYPEGCRLPVLRLVGGRQARFIKPSGLTAQIVLPSFVKAAEIGDPYNAMVVWLTPSRDYFEKRAEYFVIYSAGAGKPEKICSSSITLPSDAKQSSFFSAYIFVFLGLASYVCALLVVRIKVKGALHVAHLECKEVRRVWIVVARYFGTIFNVSLLFALGRFGPLLSERLNAFFYAYDPKARGSLFYGAYKSLWFVAEWFRFEGKDFDLFFSNVADPLYFYVLVINPFVLYYLTRPTPQEDKYYHLLLRFLSPCLGKRWVEEYGFRSKQAHVACLAICVKFFYVPLLTSWTINNIYHQNNLYTKFDWNFTQVNEFVVAFFIFVDVFIFALSYLTELPQLGNVVRSVEPTFVGWVVCIMCYPPFNKFSFKLFDIGIGFDWKLSDGYLKNSIMVAISLFWLIYLSASVALGWKASNLTNRGIISKGPYRYVRHPAYISKLCVWMLGGLFLGERTFGYTIALITVYFLRALTEERHLMADPDYVEYCKIVPYRFIPGFV